MTGTLVLLSGGQDSATALFWARRAITEGRLTKPLVALSFDYGQTHKVELECARELAACASAQECRMDVTSVMAIGGVASGLMNREIDVSDLSNYDSELPASFLPGRNLIMLTLAFTYAAINDYRDIVAGMCEEDYSGYPDCRSQALRPLETACQAGLNRPIRLHLPILNLTKAETWRLAHSLGRTDTIIHDTNTCYRGARDAPYAWGYGCDQCAACHVRAKGYKLALELGYFS